MERGRSNRVRIGDVKGSEFETICTRGMPAVPHYGVRSTFDIQTSHDVSFLYVPSFLSLCFRITPPCRGSSFFFSVSFCLSRITCRASAMHFFWFFGPQLNVNPNFETVRIPLQRFEIIQPTGNCSQLTLARFVQVLQSQLYFQLPGVTFGLYGFFGP